MGCLLFGCLLFYRGIGQMRYSRYTAKKMFRSIVTGCTISMDRTISRTIWWSIRSIVTGSMDLTVHGWHHRWFCCTILRLRYNTKMKTVADMDGDNFINARIRPFGNTDQVCKNFGDPNTRGIMKCPKSMWKRFCHVITWINPPSNTFCGKIHTLPYNF